MTWAWYTALRLLRDAVPRRWAHVQGVARRAQQVAALLEPSDRDALVAAAWLHDIGYAEELLDTGFHPLDGSRYLTTQFAPKRVCALVAHHSGAAAVAAELGLSAEPAAFPDEHTLVRDALWYCDMTVGPDGRPMTVEERIAEIRSRRGPDHPVVRALAHNLDERAAAVTRTELLLRTGGIPALTR